jgi:hypothetical protein
VADDAGRPCAQVNGEDREERAHHQDVVGDARRLQPNQPLAFVLGCPSVTRGAEGDGGVKDDLQRDERNDDQQEVVRLPRPVEMATPGGHEVGDHEQCDQDGRDPGALLSERSDSTKLVLPVSAHLIW